MKQNVKEFAELKYGMFIHYGLYAWWGRNEWILAKERMDLAEYRKALAHFKPGWDCVRNWVRLARESGMQYACLTTRHHDGFALWDSKYDDFNSFRTCGRDLVAEFTEACNAEGIAPCLYYSVGNWNDAGFRSGPEDAEGWRRFVEVCHGQLRELFSCYGRIHYLFYDGCPPPETWNAAGINAELRRLQPEVLISNRCGLEEDVPSSEQHLSPGGDFWEACLTIPQSTWTWNRFDEALRSPEELIAALMTTVHRNGNFLLNIGPDIKGNVADAEVRTLQEIALWLKRNHEAIFGVNGKPFDYEDYEISTGREGRAFFGLFGNDFGPEKILTGIGNSVTRVQVLGTGEDIAFRQENGRLHLDGLTYKKPGDLPRVIAVDFDGPPLNIPNPMCRRDRFRTD